jgi:hypothetical protein
MTQEAVLSSRIEGTQATMGEGLDFEADISPKTGDPDRTADSRIRYVVYGHNHTPLQIPIRIVNPPEGPKQHIYLNTGTWRTRYYKCRERLSFIGWKNLAYTVFYTKEERGLDFPSFAIWKGALKTI